MLMVHISNLTKECVERGVYTSFAGNRYLSRRWPRALRVTLACERVEGGRVSVRIGVRW